MLAVVVTLRDLHRQPALELRQGERGLLLGPAAGLAALGRVARGTGQAPQPFHERAVHALDMAAELRTAHRAVHQLYAVLGAARAQCPAMQVDRHRKPRPPQRAAAPVVDHDDVGLRVVDLDDVQRSGGAESARRYRSRWIVGKGRCLGFPVLGPAARHRVAPRWLQPGQQRVREPPLARQPFLRHLLDGLLAAGIRPLVAHLRPPGYRCRGAGNGVSQEPSAQLVDRGRVQSQKLPCPLGLLSRHGRRSQ
jgi:hypothetical protein